MGARSKLLALAAMSVLIVGLPDAWLIAMAVPVALFAVATGARPARLLRALAPALPFILALAAFQGLLQGGGAVIAGWWGLRITAGGVALAAFAALRMALLYLAGSAVSMTTGSTELAGVIERVLRPLDRLAGTRVGPDVATMTALALAFIPIVYEEYAAIRLAQEARGVRLGPVRGMVLVLVPLVSSLSRRADDIALAMEARCYGLDR